MQTSTLLRAASSTAITKNAAARSQNRLRQFPNLLDWMSQEFAPSSALRAMSGPIEVAGREREGLVRALGRVSLELEQALRENAAARQRHTKLARAVVLAQARAEDCEYRADYDALTQLPNRAALARTLPSMLRNAVRDGKSLVLFFVDLYGFKDVNDRQGHVAGDRVLVRLARRLGSCLREGAPHSVWVETSSSC